VANEEQTTKAPRRIRRVETIREKAEKTTNQENSPKKNGKIRAVFRVLGAPFRLVGRVLKHLGRFRILRFIGYILVPPYFRNSWRELRAVTWPTGREARRLTLAVIIFAIVFGVMIAVVDYGLDKLFKRILLK
jgi:preprotein translocase subunit SecE